MAETTYTTLDRLHTNVLGIDAGLYVCEQTATRNPENGEDTGKLSNLADGTWKLMANVNTYQLSPEIQNDEKEFQDEGNSNVRVKINDATITRRTLEFNVVNYTPLFDAIVNGVKNPMSTDYGAEQEVPIFENSDPYVPLCFKLIKRKKGVELQTQYFYGRLMVGDAVSYDGKIIEPKITIEVQTAKGGHNVAINTAAFTGQTVQTPPNDGGGA